MLVSLGYSREMKFEEILAEALASFTHVRWPWIRLDTVPKLSKEMHSSEFRLITVVFLGKSGDLTLAGRYSTEKSADQAGFLSFLALGIVQSVRESKEKH